MEDPQRAVPFGSCHWRRALLALTLVVAVASVVWTVQASRALSHTFDEPHHLATGLEWLQFGSYSWWTE
jgi:hypothetical protein